MKTQMDRELMRVFVTLCGALASAFLGIATAEAADVLPADITGPSKNRVDIITLGDGYQEHELDLYAQHVDGMIDYMFQQEPFNRYQEYFNLYRINTISNESGADAPPEGTLVDTALGATYYFDGETERSLYLDEEQAGFVVAESLLPLLLNDGFLGPEMQFVSVNSDRYGGAGGAFAVYAGANEEAYEIAVHEIAHAFAPLQDEYFFRGTTYTEDVGFAEMFANITADPDGTKWSHWIGYEQPVIGTIGVYEGAMFHEKGLFRPSDNSKMRTLGRPFDAVSREQLVLAIYDHIDPLDSFSEDAQIAEDKAISVAPIDPEVIDLTWFVNGEAIEDFSDTTLGFDQLTILGFEEGTYEISVVAQDNTDWVRIRQDELRQEVVWSNVDFVPQPIIVDIDMLTQAILAGSSNSIFDLNSDGAVDELDRDTWIESNGTLLGDADLSGTVDFVDFLALSANFGSDDAAWEEGNFTVDTSVDFDDFLWLSQNFGMSAGGAANGEASSVPEPTTNLLVVAGLGSLAAFRRRRCDGR